MTTTANTRFAALLVPQFSLQAIFRLEPDLAQKPVALVEDYARKSWVREVNAAALNATVRPGMVVPQAEARCPALITRSKLTGAETAADAVLLSAAYGLSPRVEATRPGLCMVDLRGLSGADFAASAQAVLSDLQEAGLHARAGFGPTPSLALFAARRANPMLEITDLDAFLEDAPIETGQPAGAVPDILHGWGIQTLGQFVQLPREEIAKRLGVDGLALWDAATGQDNRLLKLATPPEEFAARHEFEHAIETLDPLLFLLRRFLDQLTVQLEQAFQVAARMTLTLALDDQTRHSRDFRVPEPTCEVEVLFRMLHTHLESLRTDAPVTAVAIEIRPEDSQSRQQGLFETSMKNPQRFVDTLARLSAIVGEGRLGSPRLKDSHRPDAFTLEKLENVVDPADEERIAEAIGLPLLRFRPAPMIRVDIETPEDGPVYLDAKSANLAAAQGDLRGRVIDARGPFRASGNWWEQGTGWGREEWDLALADGSLLRVFCDGDHWFLEGRYD